MRVEVVSPEGEVKLVEAIDARELIARSDFTYAEGQKPLPEVKIAQPAAKKVKSRKTARKAPARKKVTVSKKEE